MILFVKDSIHSNILLLSSLDLRSHHRLFLSPPLSLSLSVASSLCVYTVGKKLAACVQRMLVKASFTT